MPPKSTSGWKTGDQLEFLLSHWEDFKQAQDTKKLDPFWQRVFAGWYERWPIPPSPPSSHAHESPENIRLMAQKAEKTKIKNWFNNRCRGSDTAKLGRNELKLDISGKRRLAPVQAYCTYSWKPALRDIVLARWEQQKSSTTFDDDDDPPADSDEDTDAAHIPLAFKLKIAREMYDQLPIEEKQAIDVRREEERNKLYRKIHQIEDDGERTAKLQLHKKNSPHAPGSLLRVLKNLEDQTGCVAQLLIASVNPNSGAMSIQKFCQGPTDDEDLTFEAHYGKDWEENIERRFGDWAARTLGDVGSNRRAMYMLPKTLNALSGGSTSDASPSVSSSVQLVSPSTPPTSSVQSNPPSSPITSSRTSASQPIASKKGKPQPRSSKPRPKPSAIKKPKPRSPPVRAPSTTGVSAARPVDISEAPRDTPTSAPIPPAPSTGADSLPSVSALGTGVGNDLTLVATALGVHQLLSQVAIAPQVVSAPSTNTSGNLEPSETPVDMVVQTGSGAASISSELVDNTAVATKTGPPPGARYRDRDPKAAVSTLSPRRDSIVGAPPVALVPHSDSGTPSHRDDDESSEIAVDLSSYLGAASDSEEESHVSSSQKTSDECRHLLSPPPSSQWRHSGPVGEEVTRSPPPPTLNGALLDVDDLPSWMTKKNKWEYVVSTAGGPAWKKLLEVYLEQERRLEFTDTGATLTQKSRPSKIKEYFQYAHDPSRGDRLTVPDFGEEVAGWWKEIQPEWRSAAQSPSQSRTTWSYILSGGSKGVFLVVMCLAWWDRAHARYLETMEETSDGLPEHDADWLRIVEDFTFVMEKARSDISEGMPGPSCGPKRKREQEPATPRKKPAARSTSSRTRSKA
ncbi:hypothetical protein BJ322DRAFT_1025784 [Thelephora terrestris]|uniref:Uncharacterized protein n=1 Tax=Thelephora terrestris TaxID=56493 RepID=A0A9P6H2D3_9AGAM|nr:hypothetical protein BJ322DRAFT_1025784 [Thelephora terrestris]